MDFLKDNIFYVVLAAAVLVVSVPCYIFGAARAEDVRRAQSQAGNRISQYDRRIATLKKVSPEAQERAETYKKEHEDQKGKVVAQLIRADRHMDYAFLVPPEQQGEIPSAESYKQVYLNAYGNLLERIQKAGLKSTDKSPLPPREDWGGKRPSEFAVRMSQKKYWILKALVDIFTDPECGVRSVQDIALDIDPSDPQGFNRPHGDYWIYPMRLEFQIDFRRFPLFLERLVTNEDVFFNPPGVWFVNRAFDDTKAVYVPVVSVSFDLDVWDYISTPFEQGNLAKYGKRRPAAAGARGARR